MTRPDVMMFAEEERTELLALLRSLTPSQWEVESLCTRWRVRDVATHIFSYDELTKSELVSTFLRGGLRVSTVNQVALARHASLGTDGIVDLVARNLRTRGLTSWFGGRIGFTDGTIHHQDIRRALDLPRAIPQSRLVQVLDFALQAPTLPARKNAKGLRLIATDVDWTAGEGPELTGPGEALLMALAGRQQPLGELNGAGLATVRSRIATGPE